MMLRIKVGLTCFVKGHLALSVQRQLPFVCSFVSVVYLLNMWFSVSVTGTGSRASVVCICLCHVLYSVYFCG